MTGYLTSTEINKQIPLTNLGEGTNLTMSINAETDAKLKARLLQITVTMFLRSHHNNLMIC